LRRLNRTYIKSQGIATFVPELRRLIKNKFGRELEPDYLEKIMRHYLDENRISAWKELIDAEFSFLWNSASTSAAKQNAPAYNSETAISSIEGILDQLQKLKQSTFDRKSINLAMKTFAKSNNVDYKDLMQLLRYALIGKREGPPVGELMYLLGPNETERRLQSSAETLKL